MLERLISMTSRNPSVQIIAAGGSRRVISALVATVVPWEKSVTSLRSILASCSPRIAPMRGSSGVDAVLATLSAPESSSRTQMSVNVPPISTATLRFVTNSSRRFVRYRRRTGAACLSLFLNLGLTPQPAPLYRG